MYLWNWKKLWIFWLIVPLLTACPTPPSLTLSVSETEPGDRVTANLRGISGLGAEVTVADLSAQTTSTSTSSIVFIVPATTPAGDQKVVIRNAARRAEGTLRIREAAAATVQLNLTEAMVGDLVTATLANMSGVGASVTVAGTNADISQSSTSSLQFTVPAGVPVGAQPVLISNDGKQVEANLTIIEKPGPKLMLDKSQAQRSEAVSASVTGLELTNATIGVKLADLSIEPVLGKDKIDFSIPSGAPAGRQTLVISVGNTEFKRDFLVLGDDAAQDGATILLASGYDAAALEAALNRLGFKLGHLTPLGDALASGPCTGALADIETGGIPLGEALEKLKELEADGSIPLLHIDPRTNYGIGAVNHLNAVGASNARSRGFTGAGSVIAILDTGVNPHPELGARLLTDLGVDFIAGNASPKDDFDDANLPVPPASPTPEQDGHGTPIAVLAAGETLGVAPGARVLDVKTCDESGLCPSSAVIEGACYALQTAADEANDIGLGNLILNLSLGGDTPVAALESILAYALEQGVQVAAAAGNQGSSDDFAPPQLNARHYPAAFELDGLVAVAALETDLLSCVTFDALGTERYTFGATFSSDGYALSVGTFFLEDGTEITGDGVVYADSSTDIGGSGQGVFISNASLVFDFGTPVAGLTLRFGDFGGNENLTINGELANIAELVSLDGTSLADVSIRIVAEDDIGILTLDGRIESFSIGGQELLIDNVCPLVGAEADWRPATFSTQGDYVTIAAPGRNLSSIAADGNLLTGYEGTSFATPLVAGAMALWREADASLTPTDIKSKLIDTARPLASFSGDAVGAGMLDLSSEPTLP